MTPEQRTSAEERRAELAALASAGEARNRPAHLVLLAGLALAVALAVLAWAALGRASARRELAEATELSSRVRLLADEVVSMRRAVDAGAGGRLEQVPGIRTRIVDAGVRAGLTGVTETPASSAGPVGDGVERFLLEYSHRDPSLEKLVRWVQNAVRDVPGLEVRSVEVQPEGAQWVMNVEFQRYQRGGR